MEKDFFRDGALTELGLSPQQGELWLADLAQRCPFGVSEAVLRLPQQQVQVLRDMVRGMARWTGSKAYRDQVGCDSPSLGLMLGYDFHWSHEQWQLIEVNTNPGGLALGLWQAYAAGDRHLADQLAAAVVAMFDTEWHSFEPSRPLSHVAIVDHQPQQQYLYPEFVLFKALLERSGIRLVIADPSELEQRCDGLYAGSTRLDMVYNRLTDFDLSQHPALERSYLERQVLLSPNPATYRLYADKERLCDYSDAAFLSASACPPDLAALLQQLLPPTFLITEANRQQFWDQKKQWFFKPQTGYGSRGAYRGLSVTRSAFEQLLQLPTIAQRRADPATLEHNGENWKWDLRCYSYGENVLWFSARFYQGQTTNFRSAGGGFGRVVFT